MLRRFLRAIKWILALPLRRKPRGRQISSVFPSEADHAGATPPLSSEENTEPTETLPPTPATATPPSMLPARRRDVRRNRVDLAVQQAIAASAGRRAVTEIIEATLQTFVLDDLTEDERDTWFYFRSVSTSARGDVREAFRQAENGFRVKGDSARLCVTLADLHERAGNRQRVFELLDALPHAESSGRITLLAARYAWFCDDLPRALRYVRPIIDAYYERKSGDETLLFLRGLPFVHETLYFAIAMHALRNDLSSARELVAEAQRRVEGVDLSDMMLLLDCQERDDFRPLLESLQKEASPRAVGGLAIAQAAVLHAQLTQDVDAAVAWLDQVALPRKHFPWLDDAIALAMCQLAARSGDASRVGTLRRDFLARNSLLLEPNQAVLFNLLEYQETLKPHAREARRS